jgi:tRNA (guanine-N7-)-methyltransferase
MKLSQFPYFLKKPPYPTHLEIGGGRGEFVQFLKKQFPDNLIVGIERSPIYYEKGLEKLKPFLSERFFWLMGDGVAFLLEGVCPKFWDHIWLHFPDPWPKKTHRKRRVLREEVIPLLVDRLAIGGFLHITTDSQELLRENFPILGKEPLIPSPDPISPMEEYPQTFYERKWSSKGKKIYRLHLQKVGVSRVSYPPPSPIYEIPSFPPAGTYSKRPYHLKLFPPFPNPPHLIHFLFGDGIWHTTTHGYIDRKKGEIVYYGHFTPWKKELWMMGIEQSSFKDPKELPQKGETLTESPLP